jgi:NADPH:quinone reductase-like Zn-dependent oxidoreductase
MKAVVVHQYGGPEVLKFEEYPDPIPGAGEVLVRVAATSINPFDIMRRSGSAKDVAPIKFPGIVGVDVSGTVLKIGPRVEGFSIGDRVFAMADQTYAELCLVKATTLAKIPEELDVADAAALPLVTTTGNELITVGTGVRTGQTVLVAGAVGNVGRSAIFTAKARGAVVIAGVLKRQLQEAASLGAEQSGRNRRRQRGSEFAATGCGRRYRGWEDRRKADRQSKAGRCVRLRVGSSSECQGVPDGQSSAGLRATRHEGPPLHGPSSKGWEARDSNRPKTSAERR